MKIKAATTGKFLPCSGFAEPRLAWFHAALTSLVLQLYQDGHESRHLATMLPERARSWAIALTDQKSVTGTAAERAFGPWLAAQLRGGSRLSDWM